MNLVINLHIVKKDGKINLLNIMMNHLFTIAWVDLRRGMETSWNKDGTLANMAGKLNETSRNMVGQIIYRRQKSHPYSISSYIYDGDKLLKDEYMTYIYILDKLVGFIYNETRYYYQRNIQGDITSIYKEDGTLVAKYVYDAYGRHKVLKATLEEDSDTSSIGNLNPFRYRGYYYDIATGLVHDGTKIL